MGQYRTSRQLYDAQLRRFARVGGDASRLHESLARSMRTQALGLLDGEPQGEARIKHLRKLGHPYGRGPARQKRADGGSNQMVRGRVKQLPIGVVSGRLKAALSLSRTTGRGRQSFALGAPGVEYAKYILHPAGTRWMIGRNFWGFRSGSVPKGEMGRRWRIGNRALIMTLRARMRRP